MVANSFRACLMKTSAAEAMALAERRARAVKSKSFLRSTHREVHPQTALLRACAPAAPKHPGPRNENHPPPTLKTTQEPTPLGMWFLQKTNHQHARKTPWVGSLTSRISCPGRSREAEGVRREAFCCNIPGLLSIK